MSTKLDEYGFEEVEKGHGKKPNQKLKPYLVLQYLLQQTDENHVVSGEDIANHLKEFYGIYAERRSVYHDIEAINKTMLMVEEDIDVFEAEELIKEDEGKKLVVYNKSKKGFYVRQRHYDVNDIRLLAECVYSAKFLSQGQAERLANVVCEFVSEHQAKEIRHDNLLTDRVKTDNKSVLNNISTINDAMSREIDGKKHEPEQISFNYLKYSIADVGHQIERRKGQKYIVSPYKLLINDGNYYLLAFDSASHKMRTYRVDRMKNVDRTGNPREGREVFAAIDLKTYTKRVFSMFGGEKTWVTIQFINPLLDTVIDRFGNDRYQAQYVKVDDAHFRVTSSVEISDQFFGWLLGFGKKAKLIAPDPIVEQFKTYLDKVREMY